MPDRMVFGFFRRRFSFRRVLPYNRVSDRDASSAFRESSPKTAMIHRRRRTGFVLVLLFALPLLMETLLSPVQCRQSDGQAQFELAFVGGECLCRVSHVEDEHPVTTPRCLTRLCLSCVDQPLDFPWLVRDLSVHSPLVKVLPVALFPPSAPFPHGFVADAAAPPPRCVAASPPQSFSSTVLLC